MSTYLNEVKTQKKYVPNVVILIGGTYFSIRNPDSGLLVNSPFDKCLNSLILNPTTIDPRKVSTTVASYSFRLVDLNGAISNLILGDAATMVNQEASIWLGRSFVDMPFSDYYKLPVTRIKKVEHSDNSYNFSSTEDADRMGKPIYDLVSRIAVNILFDTTIITMQDDIAGFPAAGMVRIDNEFISYTSKDLVNNRLNGCVRGELNSVPASHTALVEAFHAQTITDNPINIILRLLTSNGGGGAYATLQDGLGISQLLIDIAQMEDLKNVFFPTQQYTLTFSAITSTLKYIETELLTPNNLRFSYSINSKLSLALLDQAVFVEEGNVLNENSITKFPKWSVDANKIVNVLKVNWDYDEATKKFLKVSTAKDATSITLFGEQNPLTFNFKGLKSVLNGQALVDEFTSHLLLRLAYPIPEVEVTTHIDKSLQNIGDKSTVQSSKIPSTDGTLNFASEMEIVSRSINIKTGDVTFKLAFTSFTGIRSAYISPTDLIKTVVSQKVITVTTGRGSMYLTGWVMKLWNETTGAYASDVPNTIASIDGDQITFVNNWTTTLTSPDNFRIKFADYDEVIDSQKRYAFISDTGLNFVVDGKPTYRITY